MIRVVVADDNPVLRLGVVAHLDRCDDVAVVGEAVDGSEALALVARLDPDVLVLDVRMPGLDGLDVLERLRADGRRARVLVLTNVDDARVVHAALSRGALGYLVHPQHDLDELEHAVRRVARGEVLLGPQAAARLVALVRPPDDDDPAADVERRARRFHLSAREVEVLEHLARGSANHEIAAALHLAPKTVKNHLNRIYPKLGATSRASAMAIWRGDREPEPPRRTGSSGRGEGGQVAPLLLAALVAVAALGLALVQVARTERLADRADRGADAAALAAASEVGRRTGADGRGVPRIDAPVRRRAAALARANGTRLVALHARRQPGGWTITATVETVAVAPAGPLGLPGGPDAHVGATARAAAEVGVDAAGDATWHARLVADP